MKLKLPEGQPIVLSRIRSSEAGEETIYLGLRESFNKVVVNASWQTFFGYITKGCKSGETHLLLWCGLHS